MIENLIKYKDRPSISCRYFRWGLILRSALQNIMYNLTFLSQFIGANSSCHPSIDVLRPCVDDCVCRELASAGPATLRVCQRSRVRGSTLQENHDFIIVFTTFFSPPSDTRQSFTHTRVMVAFSCFLNRLAPRRCCHRRPPFSVYPGGLGPLMHVFLYYSQSSALSCGSALDYHGCMG